VQSAEEATPDFRWPGRVCGLAAQKLDKYSDRFINWLEAERRKKSIVGILYFALLGLLGLYVFAVFVAACYVLFPTSPYTFWEVARWLLIPVTSIVVALGLFFALIHWSVFLLFIIYLFGYLVLSLAYLALSVFKAVAGDSLWFKRSRWVILAGVLIAAGLAVFIDGSYRYWDKTFAPAAFIATLLISLAAWAALFCVIVRDKVFQPGRTGKVIKWTFILAVPVAAFVYWHAGALGVEYFLRKDVAKHPGDKNAWLNLAWHYADTANSYASYEGDDEYSPPDPTPYYEKALECFNRAVELGERGFQAHLARAQIADGLNKKREARSYGELALDLAPAGETGEVKSHIDWLREMIARNGDSAISQQDDEESKALVRSERLASLPPIIRRGVFFLE
jgi:hypothetical protein